VVANPSAVYIGCFDRETLDLIAGLADAAVEQKKDRLALDPGGGEA
jgi:hypothetical protein